MRSLPAILLALAVTAGVAAAARPGPDLLGLRLGMEDDVVRRRLEKLGVPAAGAGTLKQSWRLRHPRYGFVALRYGSDWRLRWVTAFVRPDGRRVRYSEVGPLDRAARHGRFHYTWDVRPSQGDPCRVTARGTDSLYAATVSLSPWFPPRGAGAPPDTLD